MKAEKHFFLHTLPRNKLISQQSKKKKKKDKQNNTNHHHSQKRKNKNPHQNYM